MNTSQDLLKRLLKLYPVKVVKDNFDPDENSQAEMIPEIVANNHENAIKTFALDNHNFTKQHIYFFKLNRNFQRPGFTFNGFPQILQKEIIVDGGYNFQFLPEISYDVILGNPVAQDTLVFYQPLTIRVVNNILQIQITIMEKNIEYYYGARKVYEVTKQNTEEALIQDVLDHLGNLMAWKYLI